MKKKQFKPKKQIKHLDKDFGLGQDIKIEFWSDPSRVVIFDLLEIFGMSGTEELDEIPEADKEKMNTRYFECASLILLDCDIEGIDFSTPQSTEEAFDDERLPWGIFHQALLMYISELIDEYQVLKNALGRVKELSNSGEENSSDKES